MGWPAMSEPMSSTAGAELVIGVVSAAVGSIALGAAVMKLLPIAVARIAVDGNPVVNAAARLLPGGAGPRYAEEWLGELHDMRAEGDSRRLRVRYVLGVLFLAAPHLALTLRLSRVRAVD